MTGRQGAVPPRLLRPRRGPADEFRSCPYFYSDWPAFARALHGVQGPIVIPKKSRPGVRAGINESTTMVWIGNPLPRCAVFFAPLVDPHIRIRNFQAEGCPPHADSDRKHTLPRENRPLGHLRLSFLHLRRVGPRAHNRPQDCRRRSAKTRDHSVVDFPGSHNSVLASSLENSYFIFPPRTPVRLAGSPRKLQTNSNSPCAAQGAPGFPLQNRENARFTRLKMPTL